jgi:hypothetical protein
MLAALSDNEIAFLRILLNGPADTSAFVDPSRLLDDDLVVWTPYPGHTDRGYFELSPRGARVARLLQNAPSRGAEVPET